MKDDILEYRGYTAKLYFDLKKAMITGKVDLAPDETSTFFSDSLLGITKKFHDIVDEEINKSLSYRSKPKRMIKSIYIQPRHSKAFDKLAFEQKGEKSAPELMEEAITLLLEQYEDIEYVKNLDDNYDASVPLEDVIKEALLEVELEDYPLPIMDEELKNIGNKSTFIKSFRLREDDAENLKNIISYVNNNNTRRKYSDSQVIRGLINYFSNNTGVISELYTYIASSS